jgi:hypothetical protein
MSLAGGLTIVHVRDAGVGSTLAAASIARTWNVCEPSARDEYDCGDEHAAQVAPSSEHSKVAVSVAVNERLAEWDVVVPDGPSVIVVSGGVVSRTVHAVLAGVASVFPNESAPRTENVC